MVANVALPSQYLQNSTCGAARCPKSQSTEGARPLRGHFFASKDMTALCMRRANHENAAGPQQPKEDRLKVLGNPDAGRQKPMLEPQRQKCEQSMLLPSLFGCPPFRQHRQPSSLEPRGCASRLCGCQRSCSSSELRRQTSGCFCKSDSARLTVCTGALCDRQPAFCDTPLPNDRSLATGMQCSPAVRSRGLQVRAVQNFGLRWHLIQSLSLNKCATHITAHPAVPPI